MADPVRLAHTAYALVDGDRRPEPGDVITVALRGAVAIEIVATVAAFETADDGEEAIFVDDTGGRWALSVAADRERSAA
ncbi:hypothetical protein [Pinisolibacter sp.]|uniref:hypothetical protein n=1 Tax=Pinisolibacter sp. TaxID=2172024 RepID=UPI002FDED48A